MILDIPHGLSDSSSPTRLYPVGMQSDGRLNGNIDGRLRNSPSDNTASNDALHQVNCLQLALGYAVMSIADCS
jgi:hypothetical protein